MELSELVTSVHNLVLDYMPAKTKRTPSGWSTFDCPMCNDTRGRAGVITSGAKISYNCFNCGYTTGWAPTPRIGKKFRDLSNRLGTTDKTVKEVVFNLMRHKDIFDDIEDSFEIKFEKFKKVEMPEHWNELDETSPPDATAVYEYAVNRQIDKHKLYYSNQLQFKNRVIVPFVYNQELVGYTARHINPPNKETPKYLMNSQPGYVFGLDNHVFADTKTIILMEGVFDAMLINGISCLGNTINEQQINQINSLKKRVILCPDRDAPGKELIRAVADVGWEVSFPPWHNDCKDVGDAVLKYGKLLTLDSIIKHSISNKIKIEVQSKML